MKKRKSRPQVGLSVDELCEPMSQMAAKRGRPKSDAPKVTRAIRIHPDLNQYLLSLGKNQASPAIEAAIRNSPEYRVWCMTNSASQQFSK